MTVTITTLPLTYNIRAYGAVGDGTTDDRDAIQLAYTAASAASGGTVYWPRSSGAYIIGSQINVGANTVTEFQPGATAKMKPAVTAFNVFVSGGVSGVGYRNVSLDCNKANTTSPGAPVTGAVGIYHAPTSGNSTGNFVENCTVINAYGPACRFQGHNGQTDPANLNPGEISYRDNTFKDSMYGILMVNATGGVISGNYVDGATIDGIQVNLCRGIRVSGNLVEDSAGHGIVSQYIDGCTYMGNTIRRSGLTGFTMGGGSASNSVNRNFTVVGNVSENNTLLGFTCAPTIPSGTLETVKASYSGNVSRNNGIHGFYFQCSRYFTFTGNHAYDNAVSGIAVQAKNFTIKGNTFHDNAAYGINVQADGATTPAGGDCDIDGNTFASNGTGNLGISSSAANVSGATGSKTFDWASIANGAEATTTVTVNGASLGMTASATMSVSLAGMKMSAYVSSANTVTVVMRNDTGGPVDLASGTLRAIVRSVN